MRTILSKSAGFRWIYRIEERYSWIESVADHSPDIAILVDREDDYEEYFWSSPHLNDLADLQEIEDRALELKALFDGALHLVQPMYHPLKLGDLFEYSGGSIKKSNRAEAQVGAEPFSHAFLKSGQANSENLDLMGGAIFLSRTDNDVLELLRFIGHNGITWVSLFAAHEIVNRQWKDSALENMGLAKPNELDRFKRTANNSKVLGPFARHADKNWAMPRKPMMFSEARQLILTIASRFVSERIKSKISLSE